MYIDNNNNDDDDSVVGSIIILLPKKENFILVPASVCGSAMIQCSSACPRIIQTNSHSSTLFIAFSPWELYIQRYSNNNK